VYDANAATLARYVNGQLVTNIVYDSAVPVDLSAAHIGAWNGNSRYFNGSIDELAIYPTALSADRVKAHYDASAPTATPSLSFTRTPTQLTLSWSGPGYVLQQNGNLANASGWTTAPNASTSPVTVTIGPGNLFFRLEKP